MDQEKYVDESWKDSAEHDKEKLKTTEAEGQSTDEQVAQSETSQEVPTENTATEQAEKSGHSDECGCGGHHEEGPADFQINFVNYISSLGFQALIFLGDIPNPVTNETDKNLDQAKFLIDTLVMLREKTKGNLSQQEENLLNSTVYELQMKFVETQKKDAE